VLAVVTTVVAASGCTFVIRDPGVSAGCGPLRYTVNAHDVSITDDRLAAIDDAVAEFASLVGREVDPSAPDGATAADNDPGDPLLFDLSWPAENPAGLGFAEPHVVDGAYDGGWVRLNPVIRHAPVGLIRRLVLHELGHVHGLDDVVDQNELMDPTLVASQWGPGDLAGLAITHGGGCTGSPLAAAVDALLG